MGEIWKAQAHTTR